MGFLHGMRLWILLIIQIGIVHLVLKSSSVFFDGTARVLSPAEKNWVGDFNWWLFFIQMLVAPIKEELKYRLPLGAVNLKNINLSLSILLSDVISTILSFAFIKEYDRYNLIYYALVIALSVFFFFILKVNYFKIDKRLVSLYKTRHNHLVIGSILLFAVWHCLTYIGLYNMPTITFFTVHLISACFFTFVRLRYGIQMAIVYHFVYNLPTLLVNIL